MILCLDFDDTLCDGAEAPLPGAREALDALRAVGWELVLSSARFDPLFGELLGRKVERVEAWLDRHDFPPIRVAPQLPEAACYVDDRGFRLSGDWERDLPQLLEAVGARWGGPRGRIGLFFSELWDLDQGAPAPGAAAALRELACAGCELIVFAPALPADSLALAETALQSNGFPPLRVASHKLACRLYASRRARPFLGDWRSFRLEE